MKRFFKYLLISTCAIFLALVTLWYLITQPLLSSPSKKLGLFIDPHHLEKHVRMLSEKYGPRDFRHTKNLDQVAAYIRKEFGKTSGTLEIQSYEVEDRSYQNILLKLGPQNTDQIIVGAHYDAYRELPGADDNASGVAGLLELAKLLDKTSLKKGVILAAYTLEEPPFFRTPQMGSAFHVKSIKEKNVQIRKMISLEMIGYFSDEENSQEYPFFLLKYFYPHQGNFITLVGKLGDGADIQLIKKSMISVTDLPVKSINAPQFVPGIDFSDHLNFWEKDLSAIMITDTAFYRNKNYHTKKDVSEKLDYKRMSKVITGVYEALLQLQK